MPGFLFLELAKVVKAVVDEPPIRIFNTPPCFPLPGPGYILRREREEDDRRRREREEDDRRRQEREEDDKRRREIEMLNERCKEMEKKLHDDLVNHEKCQKKALRKLARKTEMVQMKGHNIGIFGLTSTGKSTVVNSLLGRKVADTGVGETTKEVTPYQGSQYTLWDAPGRNDELTYSNQKYISFIKGLTLRLIVIQSTIKENLNLISLLEDLGLDYDIVVNKFDDVNQDEQLKFQYKIRDEIRLFGLKQKKNVFFLSAKYPRMFPDWLTMVDYLTEECVDDDHDTDTD